MALLLQAGHAIGKESVDVKVRESVCRDRASTAVEEIFGMIERQRIGTGKYKR